MSSSAFPLTDALRRSIIVHAPETLYAATRRVAGEVDAALAGERPVLLTVMNGALVFAGHLALAMQTDLEFDYVHATRYRGDTAGHDIRWLRKPAANLVGRTVLLVDDILDEGHTLKAVRDACVRELGARRVLIAVLCEKQHTRRVADIAADFVGVEVPDAYVYGFGMDYHEQGRNLPAIWALQDVTGTGAAHE